MTDTKHTPGPWACLHREGLDGKFRTQVFPANDTDNTIATCHWHSVKLDKGFTTDREANAHLIAAAPDLLEAASALIDDIKRRHPDEELRCKFMRSLDDAIAKATQ